MLKTGFFHYIAYTHFFTKNVFMIKKLTQALLALALVGGMTACDKSMKGVDEVDTSATGDTYMSVTFSTANPNSTRAAAEDGDFNSKGDYIGRDEIKSVNVYVINLPQENIDHKTFTSVTLNPDENDDTNDFRTEAWKTTPGDKIVYVYVNIAGTEIETELNKATSKAAFETANKKAFALTENGTVKAAYAKLEGGKDIIAMSPTKGVNLNVVAGAKKTEAENGTKNRANVSVRRLVAQAAVTSTAATFDIKSGSTTIAKLGNLKWDVMQFEKTTFLAPQPVDATANPAQDPMLAKYCKSPSFDFVTDDATHLFSSAADHYEYRAFTGEEVKTFTRTNVNATDVAAIVANPMKFITETTHQYGGKLEDTAAATKTGYRKGNTTYVIISAQITPDDAAWAEGEKAAYAANGANGDLFLGVQDRKFYASLDKAKAANKSTLIPESDAANAPDNVIEYTGGRCYYVAWLNPNNQETESKEPVMSPILRNNIYHVNISAIKKLGYSGNPFNPNGDDPKDPDDKTPDPKETLYPVDTYMAVEISVVNWGVHSHDAEL